MTSECYRRLLFFFKFRTSVFINSQCVLLLLINGGKKRITFVVNLQFTAIFKVCTQCDKVGVNKDVKATV